MRNVGAVRAITLTTLMVERAVAERCPPLALPDDKLAHLRCRGEGKIAAAAAQNAFMSMSERRPLVPMMPVKNALAVLMILSTAASSCDLVLDDKNNKNINISQSAKEKTNMRPNFAFDFYSKRESNFTGHEDSLHSSPRGTKGEHSFNAIRLVKKKILEFLYNSKFSNCYRN